VDTSLLPPKPKEEDVVKVRSIRWFPYDRVGVVNAVS
jgi:hypothetical protein